MYPICCPAEQVKKADRIAAAGRAKCTHRALLRAVVLQVSLEV